MRHVTLDDYIVSFISIERKEALDVPRCAIRWVQPNTPSLLVPLTPTKVEVQEGPLRKSDFPLI